VGNDIFWNKENDRLVYSVNEVSAWKT